MAQVTCKKNTVDQLTTWMFHLSPPSFGGQNVLQVEVHSCPRCFPCQGRGTWCQDCCWTDLATDDGPWFHCHVLWGDSENCHQGNAAKCTHDWGFGKLRLPRQECTGYWDFVQQFFPLTCCEITRPTAKNIVAGWISRGKNPKCKIFWNHSDLQRNSKSHLSCAQDLFQEHVLCRGRDHGPTNLSRCYACWTGPWIRWYTCIPLWVKNCGLLWRSQEKYLSLWMKMPKWRDAPYMTRARVSGCGPCVFIHVLPSEVCCDGTSLNFNIWRVLVILRSRMRSRCEFWPWKKSEPKRSCVMLGSQKRSWHSLLPVIPYSPYLSVGNCYPLKK